jgi:hemolysin activation/secretion protein
VLALRSAFSFGIDAFNSTVHDAAPDSRFVAWVGQLQWVRRLSERGDQLQLRLVGQLANDSLLPMEQFTVGGLDSVRGYRTNQLVRDEGYTGTLEYRRPLFENPSGWRNLQLALFVDTGQAKNKEGPNPEPSHLTGVGFGFLWNPAPGYFGEVYFAHGTSNLPDQPGHSVQDDGVYFRFAAYPFRPR